MPALTFASGGADRVAIGNGPAVDPCTVLAWVYPTANTTSRGIYGSRANTAASASVLRVMFNGSGGAAGNIRLQVARATTTTDYITSDTPLGTLNQWVYLMVTFDSSASPTGKIYWGTMAATLKESTYGTSTAGAGAVSATDNANGATWGNRYVGGYAQGFPGQIGPCAIFNRVFTLAEGKQWQYYPRNLAGVQAFHWLGRNGTGTQPDRSGNGWTGTVTSAAAGAGPPLGWPDLRDHDEFSITAAIAAATKARPPFQRRQRIFPVVRMF